MARVYFTDGSVGHFECENVAVVDGVLRFGANGGYAAMFAAGSWRYWIWTSAHG